MSCKKYWDHSREYERILEILDDYWTTQKDEAVVDIDMKFVHKNGECQMKHIRWRHPDILKEQDETSGLIKATSLANAKERPNPFTDLLKEAGILK